MKKILVIEDSAPTRAMFLECLEAEGFDTISAENGLVGVQQAQQQLPDLVICDIRMPQLDGYGVLMSLRQNPVTAMIPFIFLTAKANKAEVRQGMDLGADDYLTKPSTVEELLGAISAQLEKQAALRQWVAAQFQRVWEAPPADTALPPAPQSSFPSDPQLRQVFDFIEANYHQSITPSDVAQAVGYSTSYLTNLVRRRTGKTVNCWIVERRMAQTRALLRETNQTVDQIAQAVDYLSPVHFFRQFRQYHSATPQAWRNMQRIQDNIKQERQNC